MECRATFNHSPNELTHLTQQWISEQGISCIIIIILIYLLTKTCILQLDWPADCYASLGGPVNHVKYMLSVGFMLLGACLARQWMKERGIICVNFSLGFIYLAARLAR